MERDPPQNDLILAHLWIVKSVAHSLKQRCLFSAEWEELISAGNLALVKAAHRYEGRNNCQFRTYAFKFIRGEMLKSFTRIDGHHDSARLEWTDLKDVDPPQPATQVDKFYQREMQRQLMAALSSLRPRQRDTITAEFFGERPLTEVARGWDCKRDRVMKWKRTALKQLRERMTE